MAVLHAERPWLTHTALIGRRGCRGVVAGQDEDELASGLLVAVAGEETGGVAWAVLLDLDLPPRVRWQSAGPCRRRQLTRDEATVWADACAHCGGCQEDSLDGSAKP